MSDLHTSAGNGATASSGGGKKRMANSSIEGAVGKIVFAAERGGATIEVDTTKIPESIAPMVMAYGAVAILQTAYNTADDPAAAARAMIARLYAGDWRPGLPRREAEPDILTQALMEHLHKPADYIEKEWLAAYAAKHGLETGPARRRLRAHPDIAALVAKITAARAARAAAAVRKAPRESLDL